MRWLALTLVAGGVLASSARAGEPLPLRRLAFVVGANDGGPDNVRLRYAESDARAFDGVLENLGGVRAEDRLLLLSPNRSQFLAGLDHLAAMLRAVDRTSARTELIVYYSGHSDEDGLLLAGERLTYVELKRRLDAMPADVRIAILDSCESGAMTRLKGGRFRPPLAIDDSSVVKGHALLTSSAAGEAAQESDRIGGSFFTHYLVSGLRGAADANRDGRVTLNEGYQFAFNETLARTERTEAGAQHPAFDINLSGTGDLVMTDLRGTSAELVVGARVEGHLFVRGASGELAVEMHKRAGQPVALGLDPGTYDVTLARAGQLFAGKIAVADRARTELSLAMLEPVPRELATRRGPALASRTPLTFEPLVVTFLPDLCALHEDDARVWTVLALHLFGGHVAEVDGLQLGLVSAFADEAVRGFQLSMLLDDVGERGLTGGQLSFGLNLVHGGGVHGFQLAGLLDFARGPFTGLQLALGANVLDAHAEAGALAGQLALGVNLAKGDLTGVQLAMGANLAGDDVRGVQGALGLNVSGDLTGAQVALVNVAGDVEGAQVGLVNVARDVKGAQVGLVNVSREMNGVPVGLVNYAREGTVQLDLWTVPGESGAVSLKLGGWLYSLGTIAYDAGCGRCEQPPEDELALGLGLRLPLGSWFFLAGDVSAGGAALASTKSDAFLELARAFVGVQPWTHFGLIAGVTQRALLATGARSFGQAAFFAGLQL